MRRLPLFAALLALALPVSASAFNRSHVPTTDGTVGPALYWCTRSIPFTLNEAGDANAGAEASLTAARQSFDAWTHTDCSDLEFSDQGTTSRTDVGFDSTSGATDNINLVIWRESTCSRAAPANDPCLTAGGCNNKYNCFDESAATIALTTTTFNNKTGEIYDSDIELNAAAYVFTTVDGPTCSNPPPRPATNCVGTDIRNTLTHEIGHVLGLDHASDPTATMYPTAALGETSKRVLHTDDINGLCAIYPKGVAIAACATSQNPTNKTCGCGSGGEPLAGLAAALAALALYRRRPCAT